MAFAEVISIVKIGGAIVGSSFATLLLSKWLGKKKEEIEIASDLQGLYKKHIASIKVLHLDEIDSIKKLHARQIAEFVHELKELNKKVNKLVASNKLQEEEKEKFVQEAYEKDMAIDKLEKRVKVLQNGTA